MGGWVYILASKQNGTIYIGVTSELQNRVVEHRSGLTPGFASKYGCKNLVWYERHENIESVIQREKSIKRYKRTWKIRLIEELNPDWNDFFESCYERDNLYQPSFTKQFEPLPDNPNNKSTSMDPRHGGRG